MSTGHETRPSAFRNHAIAAWCVALASSMGVCAAERDHAPGVKPGVRRGPPPTQWHGDIARFHQHDWNVWRSGRWVHERHDGRIGWWWVIGGLWYFYPSPVYPYPNPWEPPPAPLVSPLPGTVLPPPQTQFWYYCDASGNYYPYVASCPGGWRQVPAAPAPSN